MHHNSSHNSFKMFHKIVVKNIASTKLGLRNFSNVITNANQLTVVDKPFWKENLRYGILISVGIFGIYGIAHFDFDPIQ